MPHRQQHVTRREAERQDVHRQGMGGWGLPAGGTLERRVRSGSGVGWGVRHSGQGAPLWPLEAGAAVWERARDAVGRGGGPGVWTTWRNLARGLRLLHQALGSRGGLLSRDGS